MTYLWLFLIISACGGDNGDDTVLTGFSGVLIFGIVAYVIYRYVKKKS